MPTMTTQKCACCKQAFQARTADVKRGWGKFCSKSCKAIKQEQRTGQYSAYKNRRTPEYLREDDDTHPFSSDALGQG